MSTNKNKVVDWVRKNMISKIEVAEEIIDYKSKIRGVYGIFSFNETTQEETCLYIGKSVNIYARMFIGTNAHVVRLKNEDYMFKTFEDCMNHDDEKLIVKVLKEVPYQYDNFNRDAQRLAYAECKLIECYQQQKNQCLDQLPEGVNKDNEIEEWNQRRITLYEN